MALLTTFTTTPVVSVLYPPWYQVKIEAWKRGEIDWETGQPIRSSQSEDAESNKPTLKRIGRLLVYLRLDNMPALLNLLSLFGSSGNDQDVTQIENEQSQDETENSILSEGPKRAVWAHGIRLLQLTDRDSSVMTVSQVADYSRHDPIVNTFRTVGQLHNLAASGEVAIMPETRFAEALATKSAKMSSDLLLVPWSETGGMGDSQILSSATVDDKMASSYGTFVKSVLESHQQNVAVFFSRNDEADSSSKSVDRKALSRTYSFGVLKEDVPAAPLLKKPYHIFLAYFGGDDDKLALRVVLQLCEKSKATATILRVATSTATSSSSEPDLFDLAKERLPGNTSERVKFETVTGATTVEDVLISARNEVDTSDNKTPYLIVAGRGSGSDLDEGKLDGKTREDLRNCLGAIAANYVAGGVRADLLVVQSRKVEES